MRTRLVSCSFAFFLILAVSGKEVPTRSIVEQIERDLEKEVFWGDWGTGGQRKLPAAVRLAFHDCVGGCDGCINPNEPGNSGLKSFVESLEPTFEKYKKFLTRADFWALTSIYALRETNELNNRDCHDDQECKTPAELNIVFKYGREDCAGGPFITKKENLPKGKFGFKETMQYFKEEFRFTEEESVALLGAHTLGRAMTNQSGFQGSWTNGQEEMLNNQFFKTLANSSIGWFQEASTPERSDDPHWQWRLPNDNVTFTINPDIALFKDIQVNEEGKSSCSFEACPRSPTANLVETFARSNKVWIEAFEKVFIKMLAHGSNSLHDVQ